MILLQVEEESTMNLTPLSSNTNNSW